MCVCDRLSHRDVYTQELSVCLFQTKMGELPPCTTQSGTGSKNLLLAQTRSATKQSVRARNGSRTSMYDVSVLKGWRDEIDGPVYAAAEARFNAELLSLGLSLSRCRARLPAAPLMF